MNICGFDFEHTYFGNQTSAETNGCQAFEDGSVRVFSVNGGGKIVPKSTDGLSFYYTKIRSDQNFTIKAKVQVNQWKYSNGQEGFGIMACDRIGVGQKDFWNNQIMSVITAVQYFWDKKKQRKTNDYSKDWVKMNLGACAIARTGVDNDNMSLFKSDAASAMKKFFVTDQTPLDFSAAGLGSGNYNLVTKGVGNNPGINLDTAREEFELCIQKNNSGYFVSYTDGNGKVNTKKYYFDMSKDPLTCLEQGYVYAGFFAARHMDVTFKDIEITTVAAVDDAPAMQPVIEPEDVAFFIGSHNYANSSKYELLVIPDQDSRIQVQDEKGELVGCGDALKDNYARITLTLKEGVNPVTVSAFPAENSLPSGYDAKDFMTKKDFSITYVRPKSMLKEVYVSPTGKPEGTGTIDNPMSIGEALRCPMPGQTIYMQGGVYELHELLEIGRGISGTEAEPITLKAAGSDKERPILDFCETGEGFVSAGDYWIFDGFDVTRSKDGYYGFKVSGSNCEVRNVNMHHNGASGMQIAILYGFDEHRLWPHDILVKNCKAYENNITGFKNADGFAAKISPGANIIFDSCVSHHNADDGWDLYNKAEMGKTGPIIIRNCIAYSNGFVHDKETGKLISAGNGNGFKMGGENVQSNHRLENSLSFHNKGYGIDSNTCPNFEVYDSVSIDNHSANVALYAGNVDHTAFKASGVKSFRRKVAMACADIVAVKGDQKIEDCYNDTTEYYGEIGL